MCIGITVENHCDITFLIGQYILKNLLKSMIFVIILQESDILFGSFVREKFNIAVKFHILTKQGSNFYGDQSKMKSHQRIVENN